MSRISRFLNLQLGFDRTIKARGKEIIMATAQKNAELTVKFGKSVKDTGSTAVQIAVLTERINELAPHFDKNPKDHSGKRGLLKMIGLRRTLLNTKK
jgi:small subunit ribosomal protein S15